MFNVRIVRICQNNNNNRNVIRENKKKQEINLTEQNKNVKKDETYQTVN